MNMKRWLTNNQGQVMVFANTRKKYDLFLVLTCNHGKITNN